ncbi:hypothetical protein SLEP1_g26194 [Rubroshorea leprosula]|uniref:Uncharacterized protein n=1 Tax=Rubroshorea leprosula TaxID=152421 RepID=A0AAV5JWY1_9ROSI|nr:hypothetical protein SLEP1_g26194 [Rubroshorea leprosula]
MISSEPCALVGPVSRVYGVCHVPGFGLWGVTIILYDLIQLCLLPFMCTGLRC